MSSRVRVHRAVVEGIEVEVLEFDDTVETVEKASRVSGEPANRIAKTVLLKGGSGYLVVVARGDRRIDYGKVARLLGHRATLADVADVKKVLGVEPGALTPISSAVKSLRVILDPAILELDYVLCGSGALNKLYRVKARDLVSYLKPEIVDIFR